MSRSPRMTEQQLIDHQKSNLNNRRETFILTSRERLFAKGRMRADELNKTEQRYHDHLSALKYEGKILWFMPHPLSLKLAPNTHYRPDFAVLTTDNILDIIDVKGSKKIIQDDSHAKIKIAASLFPFRFFYVFPKKNGEWETIGV